MLQQIHWLEAERAACQGVFRAAAGATLAGLLPEPPGAPPAAAEQRFSQVTAQMSITWDPAARCAAPRLAGHTPHVSQQPPCCLALRTTASCSAILSTAVSI